MTGLREAIERIADFLSPSLANGKNEAPIERLHSTIPLSWTCENRTVRSNEAQVVLYCVDLLKTLPTVCNEDRTQLGVKDWRYVNALIDILVIVGLYKTLSPGVGLPESRRIKSALLQRQGSSATLAGNESTLVLESIVLGLKEIVEQGGEIGESVLRKHLADILSGWLELAFNPSRSEVERFSWESQYNRFLSR